MAKKLFVTSFKGGTGVTTFCVGLGRALSRLGERTLIVDGDFRSGCALIMGECKDFQVYTLGDYEKGACRAKQTLVFHPKESNLCFTSSVGVTDFKYASQAVLDVDGLFDYILLDKISPEVSNGAIIVTEPYAPSIKSADFCRSALADNGFKDIWLAVNKLNGGQIINGDVMTAHEIATLLRLPLKAVIPEDLTLSSGKCKPPTLKAFKTSAECITGRREDYCNVLKGYGGINGIIKRKLREKI